jgi:zinc transport system ATP-binding protein
MIGEGLKECEIGYLPQQRAAQKDFPAGVYEIVLSGRLNAQGLWPFYSKADKKAVEENLERLNIASLRNQCYRELSGGQQQRVLLARSLCAARKLLLLDEPAAGLDPLITMDVYQLLKKVNEEMGMTIMMVSHDAQGAMRYASHILHLQNEQIFFGTKEEYAESSVGKRYLQGGGRND